MIKKITKRDDKKSVLFFVTESKDIAALPLSSAEIRYIQKENKENNTLFFEFDRIGKYCFIQLSDNKKKNNYSIAENNRKAGDVFLQILKKHRLADIQIEDISKNEECIYFIEGLALSNYNFNKYKTYTKKAYTLNTVSVLSEVIDIKCVAYLNIIVNYVHQCRDLVNEPNCFQNAEDLAQSFYKMGRKVGVKVDIFNKAKIESLKMGGLLGVNKGSVDAPTFTVMEWKPAPAQNKRPIVLVGKGLVFDTGGMNIKTGGYMSDMKQDMAGAATMASVVCAIAALKIPVHIVALLPATDNRSNGHAMVPGDILRMHNGSTVEVENTDAEGRLILADAISYAKKYKPQLLIDAATLTGAASRAVGKFGIVAMHNDAEEMMGKLKISGNEVYERIAEFPFWDEYSDLIKSDVADIKNSGAPEAGMITAGKFLQTFTDFPYIHLDIAGVAFAPKKYTYYGLGGTGFGVRLLINFISNQIKK